MKQFVALGLAGILWGAGATEYGALEVKLEGQGQAPLHGEGYVAVYRPEDSPEKPFLERLLSAPDHRLRWELPPGEYGVVCSGWGFVGKGPVPVVVRAGEVVEWVCELQPLATVRGRVVDEEGRAPIVGAQVALSSVVGEGEVQGSPLLRQHVRAKHATETDKTGQFAIGLRAETQSYLVVTAAACAPQLLPVRAGKEGVDLGEIRLFRGGEVVLEIVGPNVWGEHEPWLVLYPQREAESLTVDEERAWGELRKQRLKLLRRRVSPSGVSVLANVPPGSYLPVLQPREDVVFQSGQAPIFILPAITVLPGARATLAFRTGLTRVVGTVCPLPDDAQGELVVAANIGGFKVPLKGNEREAHFELHVPGPANYEVSLRLEDGTPFGRRRRQPLGWLSVGEGLAERDVTWKVSPLVLRGRVVGPQGHGVFAAQVVVTERRGECRGIVPGSYECNVETDAEGRFTCPAVPPRPLVLLVSHRTGFAYLQDVRATEGGELAVSLRPGMPLEGQVGGGAGRRYADVTVRYYPEGFRLPLTTMNENDGVFRFAAVPQTGGVLTCSFSPNDRTVGAGDTVVEVEKGTGFVAVDPAQEAGVVVRWSGDARSKGLALIALEPRGLPLWGSPFLQEVAPLDLFPGQEKVSFPGIGAGRFRAVALDRECRPLARSRPVRVGEGEYAVVHLDF